MIATKKAVQKLEKRIDDLAERVGGPTKMSMSEVYLRYFFGGASHEKRLEQIEENLDLIFKHLGVERKEVAAKTVLVKKAAR